MREEFQNLIEIFTPGALLEGPKYRCNGQRQSKNDEFIQCVTIENRQGPVYDMK